MLIDLKLTEITFYLFDIFEILTLTELRNRIFELSSDIQAQKTEKQNDSHLSPLVSSLFYFFYYTPRKIPKRKS